MLEKLFNIGKKEKFRLELDESEIANKVEAVATQVKPETKQVVKEAKQVVEEAKPAIASKVENIKSEVTQVIEDVTSEDSQTAPEAKKGSAKKASTKQKKKDSSSKVASSPQVIDTSYSEEPFWVKLMYKTNEQQVAEQKAEEGFATKYLISKPKPRRRPGGSVDKFKDMARQTKVRF